jgi:hypothetical protein
MQPRHLVGNRPRWHQRALVLPVLAAIMTTLVVPLPVYALDVYINGVRATGVKLAELLNCTVRFDAEGNLHILSPGYRVITDEAGAPRVEGHTDLAGAKPAPTTAAKLKHRYVLTYQPHPRVNYAFDVYLGSKLFRQIGLDTGPFTVEISQELRAGDNILRVVGRPGDAVPGGGETDVASLRIYAGDATADGTFVARTPPIWELVRAAVDRQALDRSYTLTVE